MKVVQIVFVTAALSYVFAFGQTAAKTDDSILTRRVSLPEFRYSETPSIFERALIKAQLPGGIVNVNCDDARYRFAFSPRDASMRDLLSSLETIDPSYKAELHDGV